MIGRLGFPLLVVVVALLVAPYGSLGRQPPLPPEINESLSQHVSVVDQKFLADRRYRGPGLPVTGMLLVENRSDIVVTVAMSTTLVHRFSGDADSCTDEESGFNRWGRVGRPSVTIMPGESAWTVCDRVFFDKEDGGQFDVHGEISYLQPSDWSTLEPLAEPKVERTELHSNSDYLSDPDSMWRDYLLHTVVNSHAQGASASFLSLAYNIHGYIVGGCAGSAEIGYGETKLSCEDTIFRHPSLPVETRTYLFTAQPMTP